MKKPNYIETSTTWSPMKGIACAMFDRSPEDTKLLTVNNYQTVMEDVPYDTPPDLFDAAEKLLKHRSLRYHRIFFKGAVSKYGYGGRATLYVGHIRANGFFGEIHARGKLTLHSPYIDRGRVDHVTDLYSTFSTSNPGTLARVVSCLPIPTDTEFVKAAVMHFNGRDELTTSKPTMCELPYIDTYTFARGTPLALDRLLTAIDNGDPIPKDAVETLKEKLGKTSFYEYKEKYEREMATYETVNDKTRLFLCKLPRWYNTPKLAVSNGDASTMGMFDTSVHELPEGVLTKMAALAVNAQELRGVSGIGVVDKYLSKNRDKSTPYDVAAMLVDPEDAQAVLDKLEPLQ